MEEGAVIFANDRTSQQLAIGLLEDGNWQTVNVNPQELIMRAFQGLAAHQEYEGKLLAVRKKYCTVFLLTDISRRHGSFGEARESQIGKFSENQLENLVRFWTALGDCVFQ